MTNYCSNCGAINDEDAEFCSSCGSRLTGEHRRGETVIDVTTGEPSIVAEEPAQSPEGFASSQFGRVRVYTAQSRSPAVCLIPVAVVLLLFACACIGFFAVVDNIFRF